MKNILFLISLSFFIVVSTMIKAQSVDIKFVYQARNVFINNPMLDDVGKIYCINKIFINEKEYICDKYTSVIGIYLENLNIEVGEMVEIQIFNKEECTPTIVNPEIFENFCLFEIISKDLKNNVLSFSTRFETVASPFYIQEYRFDNWRNIDTIQGVGGAGNHNYKISVTPFLGINNYRIYQIDFYGQKTYSEVLSFSNVKRPNSIVSKNNNQIVLKEDATYSIVDNLGNELQNGTQKTIDISNLSDGNYFLCFENHYAEFTIKKTKIKFGEITEFPVTKEVFNEKLKHDMLKLQNKR
ncbi:MAG: hypothetical protein LBV69_11170 [Bacteroidales bacterium]|jgi:hypothetical protein|nr:hypothetical protein [Bacteroidales bacterium]